MVRNNKPTYTADNLWIMAHDAQLVEDPAELRLRRVDEIFHREIELRVMKKELLNMNINGPVRSGKSTAAQQLCMDVKGYIKQHHGFDRPMTNKNIQRDQNEYARIVKRRDKDFKMECDVIDEWAEMELTGFNSTIEQKFLKDFSDRQAARYYHRIACSPTDVTDSNADILLSTIPGSMDKRKCTTDFLLYYRLTEGQISEYVLLGRVVICCREALESSWYQEYLRAKEEKWELMNIHNVQSPRQLEYASIIYATYIECRGDAQIGLVQKKHFKLALQEEADKRGVWFSILGDRDVLETLEGMMEQTYAIETFTTKAHNEKNPERKVVYLNAVKRAKERLVKTRVRLRKLEKLWNEYQLLDGTGTLADEQQARTKVKT